MTLSYEFTKFVLFPGLRASFHQRQNHCRDFGSNDLPHRETHHTQGHQARKHFSGQGLPHQGKSHTMACNTFVILTTCMWSHINVSMLSPVFSRSQTSAWPPARHGANSQKRNLAGRVARGNQLGQEAPAHWATWPLSTWRVYTRCPLRSLTSTASRLWFGSSSQSKSHMQVSSDAETGTSPKTIQVLSWITVRGCF